jgi:hypothetical protein
MVHCKQAIPELTWSDTQKKKGLALLLGNLEWEGTGKEMVIEHVLICHRETTLNSIALLSTNGRVFKYRRFLTLGRKMLE